MSDQELSIRGPRKVVDADELQLATESGWVLLESFEETDVETCFGSEPRQVPDPSNCYNDGAVSTTRHLVTTTRKFLVGYDEDGALTLRSEELEEAGLKLKEVRKLLVEVESARDTFKATSERDRGLIETQDRLLEEAGTKNRELEERCRKMEGDLAKIQKAIGGLHLASP